MSHLRSIIREVMHPGIASDTQPPIPRSSVGDAAADAVDEDMLLLQQSLIDAQSKGDWPEVEKLSAELSDMEADKEASMSEK